MDCRSRRPRVITDGGKFLRLMAQLIGLIRVRLDANRYAFPSLCSDADPLGEPAEMLCQPRAVICHRGGQKLLFGKHAGLPSGAS